MFSWKHHSLLLQGAVLFSLTSYIACKDEVAVILQKGESIDNCEGPSCSESNVRLTHDGKCWLILQGDGKILMRDNISWNKIWDSSNEGFDVKATLNMQGDCNLVINEEGKGPLWSTGTAASDLDDDCFLGVYEDCRLAVFKGTPENPAGELWTNIRLDGLHAGDNLQNGEIAHDPDNGVFWIFQNDGNFVAYEDEVDIGVGDEEEMFDCSEDLSQLWQCIPDGYTPNIERTVLWASGTAGYLGWDETGRLHVKKNGKLQITKKTTDGPEVIWTSASLWNCDLTLSLDANNNPVYVCA